MTEAGPLYLTDDDNSDTEEGVDKQTRGKLDYDLSGSMPNCGRAVVRTKRLKIAPTGRSFAATTTEGVLVYSIDESSIFDPTGLDIDVTPEELCKSLGSSIQQNSRNLLHSLKSLQKAITRIHQDLADTCSSSKYMLRYLRSVGKGSDQVCVDTCFSIC